MRSTMLRMRDTRNAERARFARSRTGVQVGTARHTSAEQDGVIASYDIDPGDTIEAVVCALLLVPLSITCVVIIGALRAVSGR